MDVTWSIHHTTSTLDHGAVKGNHHQFRYLIQDELSHTVHFCLQMYIDLVLQIAFCVGRGAVDVHSLWVAYSKRHLVHRVAHLVVGSFVYCQRHYRNVL